jgi:hypothetical protein
MALYQAEAFIVLAAVLALLMSGRMPLQFDRASVWPDFSVGSPAVSHSGMPPRNQ